MRRGAANAPASQLLSRTEFPDRRREAPSHLLATPGSTRVASEPVVPDRESFPVAEGLLAQTDCIILTPLVRR
jgi:hypothetical protein